MDDSQICWAKETRRVDTMLFHFYDILEWAKPTFSNRNQNSDCLCRGQGVGQESRMWSLNGRRHEKLCGDGNVLCIYWWFWVYRIAYLSSTHFMQSMLQINSNNKKWISTSYVMDLLHFSICHILEYAFHSMSFLLHIYFSLEPNLNTLVCHRLLGHPRIQDLGSMYSSAPRLGHHLQEPRQIWSQRPTFQWLWLLLPSMAWWQLSLLPNSKEENLTLCTWTPAWVIWLLALCKVCSAALSVSEFLSLIFPEELFLWSHHLPLFSL